FPFSSTPPPPPAPLLPYTTLFRSRWTETRLFLQRPCVADAVRVAADQAAAAVDDGVDGADAAGVLLDFIQMVHDRHLVGDRHVRSEEHTSELQSRENLVCRLLLEK